MNESVCWCLALVVSALVELAVGSEDSAVKTRRIASAAAAESPGHENRRAEKAAEESMRPRPSGRHPVLGGTTV